MTPSESSPYAVWGWGEQHEAPRADELAGLASVVPSVMGFAPGDPLEQAPLADARAPRIALPPALRDLASDDPDDRARHALGRSYLDLIRGLTGQIEPRPDLVLRPRTDDDVEHVLSWASDGGVGVVPFGGGSSVVGGVGPVPEAVDRPIVSLDLGRLSGV